MVKGARPACPALRNMARDVTFQVVILLLLATSLAFGSDGWDFRGRVLWGAPGQGGPAVPALPSGSGGSGPGSLGYGGPPPALAELQTFARSVPADPASQLRSRPLGLYSTTPTSPPPVSASLYQGSEPPTERASTPDAPPFLRCLQSPLDLQSIVASYDAAQQQPGACFPCVGTPPLPPS